MAAAIPDCETAVDAQAAAAAETNAEAEAPTPPELVAAIDHLTAEHFEEALAGAVVHSTAAQAGLRIDALRLCALATARLGRWEASLAYWNKLYEEEPSTLNALQIGTTYAMTGDVAEGETWIERARERNAVSRDMPDLQIVTNFISALVQSGQAAQALPWLDDVRAVYVSLGITDPTFLYLRRIPLFGAFLENSLPIIGVALDKDEGRAWYASMLSHLDEAGQQQLTAWLEQRFPSMGAPVAV